MGKSKMMKTLKQNCINNQSKSMRELKKENLIPKQTIDVTIKDTLQVHVATQGRFFQQSEVVELVTDIFAMRKNLSNNEIIEMSKMCDTAIDFKFLESKIENGITNAYLNIC